MFFQILWKYKIADEHHTKIYYFEENHLSNSLKKLFLLDNNNFCITNFKIANDILNDILISYQRLNPQNVEINRKISIVIEDEPSSNSQLQNYLLNDENMSFHYEKELQDEDDIEVSETEDRNYLEGYQIGQDGQKDFIFKIAQDRNTNINKKYGILDGIIDSEKNNCLLNGFIKQNLNIFDNDVLEPAFEHAVFLNKENNAKTICSFFQGTNEEIEELLLTSLIYVKSKNCKHYSIIENLLRKKKL